MMSSAAAATAPLTASPKRGALILFEGLDRSGKSTQCVKLFERLAALPPLNTVALAPSTAASATGSAKPEATAEAKAEGKAEGKETASAGAIHLRFPARETAVGKMIDAYLKNNSGLDDQAIHLLFSANRWESVERMRTALLSGQHVVVDRYSYSGVAYSAAKGLALDWCMAPEKGLPSPDLTIFIRLSTEEAAKRGGFGTERYETKPFQLAVAKSFDAIVRRHNATPVTVATAPAALAAAATAAGGGSGSWVVLDGAASVDALHETVWTLATAAIAEAASKPIAAL